jgi:hypothetical protein
MKKLAGKIAASQYDIDSQEGDVGLCRLYLSLCFGGYCDIEVLGGYRRAFVKQGVCIFPLCHPVFNCTNWFQDIVMGGYRFGVCVRKNVKTKSLLVIIVALLILAA